MKIVIDIPEVEYEKIMNGYMPLYEAANLIRDIQNGTPLPKGHGRLIDADALQKFANEQEEKYGISIIDIDEQPTIIEADKEDNE